MARDGDARRKSILDFIIKYKREHDGCSPSLREIRDDAKVASYTSILYHLRILDASGKIVLGPPGQTRSIQVVGGTWSRADKVPLPKSVTACVDCGGEIVNENGTLRFYHTGLCWKCEEERGAVGAMGALDE